MDHISGKINILLAIIIEIADTYTTTIINIYNIQRIDGIILNNFVVKSDAGMRGRDFFK